MDAIMGTPKKPDPAPKDDRGNRKAAPVQVKKDLARWIAVIATHDGITQADLLDPWLRQRVLTEYQRVQREMGKEIAALGEA